MNCPSKREASGGDDNGNNETAGGGGLAEIFVQNQVESFCSMDFERRGRAGLSFVRLVKMLQMGIPFLLFTLT